VGDYRIAVVSQQLAAGSIVGKRGAFCRFGKKPAFVLIWDGPVTTALDMTGGKVPIAKVTALCPAVANL
jgi:hypothetical protein